MNTFFRCLVVPSLALGLAGAEASAGPGRRDARHVGAAIGALAAGLAIGAAIAGARRHRQPVEAIAPDEDAFAPAQPPTYAQYPYGYETDAPPYPPRRPRWTAPPAYGHGYPARPYAYRYDRDGRRGYPHGFNAPDQGGVQRGPDGSATK